MAKEIQFSKQGNLYVSHPIEATGEVTVQVGFMLNGGWVKVETAISPEDGWSLFSHDQAPRIPSLFSKSVPTVPGMFVRVTTNQMPRAALFLGGEQVVIPDKPSAGGGMTTQVVPSLGSITNPRENIIYLVRNGEEGDNVYDEYIYINGHFELLGSSTLRTQTDITEIVNKVAVTEEDIEELFKWQ